MGVQDVERDPPNPDSFTTLSRNENQGKESMQSQTPSIPSEQILQAPPADLRCRFSSIFSPSSSSTMVEETEIGKEEEEEEEKEQEEAVLGSHINRFQKGSSFREMRRYPPPIPLLAQTGHLPGHMPWVLKRTYQSDGHLVLQEVRVKHHEFFRAHRANGRLILQLIHFEESPKWPQPNDGVQEDEYQKSNEKQEDDNQEENHKEEGGGGGDPPHSSVLSSSPSLPCEKNQTKGSDAETPALAISPSIPAPAAKEIQITAMRREKCDCVGENLNSNASVGIGTAWCSEAGRNPLFHVPVPTIRPVLG